MDAARTSLWRIEYQTDKTKAGSPIVPLAFLAEADWPEGARWMGMLFRKSLTKNELNASDLETWPELRAPEPFLKAMFDEAWKAEPGCGGLALVCKYSNRSALQVSSERPGAELINLTLGDRPNVFSALKEHMWVFKNRLQPALKADVVSLQRKRQRRTPSEPDVGEKVKVAPDPVAA